MVPITLESRETSTAAPVDEFDRWEITAHYSPKFKDKIRRELDRIALLPENWDREGAKPIDPAIIEAARCFIERLPAHIASTPAVVPSADGYLQFEWNDGPRSLELEVETPSTIHYLKWCPEMGTEEEGFFDIQDDWLAVSLIRWFTRGMRND